MPQTTQRWQRVKEIFDATVDLAPEEQEAALDRHCGTDAGLRQEIEALLRADAEADAGGFIDTAIGELPRELWDDSAEAVVGRKFGVYEVIREIGRGGLGTVYLGARADDQFKKEVAIKVVRRGLDTEDILRRFRNERQILAQLEHPNIARLIDGGTNEVGLPYFVMEHVPGQPILTYCDSARLDTTARLQLFRKVCAAVSYAHQHLVIHRDLKPSNILVTPEGEPKLLDFGIAKLLSADDAQSFTLTMPRHRVMTPEYASPEQIKGEKITTTSDVYSLGVLLYELLTGQKPYRLTTSTPEEISRAVVDQAPERPSTAARAAALEPAEKTGSRSWATTLRGDVDNIVLMALRKEPTRRYASVAQFADDIGRYLEGRTVLAHKDTLAYRAGKFIRRNKVGVAAAAVVLLSLVGGIIATAWQARRAAEQARVAAQERDRARVEAAKSARINDFLQHVLGFSQVDWRSPNPEKKNVSTIAEALDEASRRAERELADQPEILAAVQFTLGVSYAAQGKLDVAVQQLQASLEKRRRVLGSEHPETAQSMSALTEQIIYQGKFREAESLAREAVGVYRRLRERGDVNPLWFTIALNGLGVSLSSTGDATAAEPILLEAVEVGTNLTGEERGLLAVIYNNLSIARGNLGDIDGAVHYLEKSVDEFRRLPAEPGANFGAGLSNLGSFMTIKGEYDRADAVLREALEVFRKTVGEKHLFTAMAIIYLADNYCEAGDYSRALEEVNRALALQREILQEGHIDFGRTWTVLGKILSRTGELARGEEHLRNALAVRAKGLKPGHPAIAGTQGALAECLTAQTRFDEAEPLLVESLAALEKTLGARDPRTARARHRLSKLYEAWGKPDEAARYR